MTIRVDAPRAAHPAVAHHFSAEEVRLEPRERAQRRAVVAQRLRAADPALTVLATDETLAPFETDAFIVYRNVPLVAVLPVSAEQACLAVRVLLELGVPIVSRGAGTGISGGSLPLADGALLVMTKMRKMLAVSVLARTATVEPGHRNLAVSEAVAKHGLFYAPDPSSQIISSIGGNVAENAGGVHCLKYGFTTHNVMQVKAVDGEGDAITLGSHALDAAGYDLLALTVGSEGCLGLVTEATLKLMPLPQVTVTLLASFNSVQSACEAVGAIIANGVIPAALEMMDKIVVRACERFMQAGFPQDAQALLLCELDGAAEEVEATRLQVEQLLKEFGAVEIRQAKDDVERAKLWRSRKGAFAALATLKPDYYTIDGTIPRRALPHVLAQTEAMAEQAGLLVANVFHAGDGNIHPCIFYDSDKSGELERSEQLASRILELCVEVGGTITGEHGVGVEKLKQMCVQFGEGEIRTFFDVKHAFDPNDRFNPGKAVPTPKRCAEWGGMHVRSGNLPHPDIPRF